jgi:hypothetical protein
VQFCLKLFPKSRRKSFVFVGLSLGRNGYISLILLETLSQFSPKKFSVSWLGNDLERRYMWGRESLRGLEGYWVVRASQAKASALGLTTPAWPVWLDSRPFATRARRAL